MLGTGYFLKINSQQEKQMCPSAAVLHDITVFQQKQGLFHSFNPQSTMARSHTTRNRDYKLQFLIRSVSKFSVALYVVNLIEYFGCLTPQQTSETILNR